MKGFHSCNKITGLQGFDVFIGTGNGSYGEISFEDVIFEEAGFFPAEEANVITVSVDVQVAVSFPADIDVDVIAKFIRKMGKEVGYVES